MTNDDSTLYARSTDRLNAAPRCHATSKHTGCLCKAPAVKGWKVCRMHGARGGAPTGSRNGNYRHGASTKETKEYLGAMRSLARSMAEALPQEATDA